MTSVPVLDAVEGALVARFGHQPQRASVSFVGVDPIEVLRFEPAAGERCYVTLGMSRYPMTGADEAVRSAQGPRAELLLLLDDPTDRFADVWRTLAVLAAAPAVEGVVYAEGISSDLGTPLAPRASCTGVVVAAPAMPAIDTPDGAVDVFTVLPAGQTELAWCRVRGSAELRARWERAGTDLHDLARAPVRLDADA